MAADYYIPKRVFLTLGATFAVAATTPIDGIASTQMAPAEQLLALRAAARGGTLQLLSSTKSGQLKPVEDWQKSEWDTRDSGQEPPPKPEKPK